MYEGSTPNQGATFIFILLVSLQTFCNTFSNAALKTI